MEGASSLAFCLLGAFVTRFKQLWAHWLLLQLVSCSLSFFLTVSSVTVTITLARLSFCSFPLQLLRKVPSNSIIASLGDRSERERVKKGEGKEMHIAPVDLQMCAPFFSFCYLRERARCILPDLWKRRRTSFTLSLCAGCCLLYQL